MSGPGLSAVKRWVERIDVRVVWGLVALLFFLLALDLVRVARITNHHDIDVYFSAAQRLVAGEELYLHEARFKEAVESGAFSMKDDSVEWPYASTPGLALLFAPFARWPLAVVRWGWWSLNIVALLAGCWLCLSAMGNVNPWGLALALACLYRFEPAVVALRLGQVEIVQFALLAYMLYALSRGQEARAGISLGLAAGLKMIPLALIALLVWQRRWRAVVWAGVVSLVTVLGSFIPVGLEGMRTYFSYASMYGIAGAYSAFPYNQSLNGFISRNLIHNIFSATLAGLHLPGLAKTLILASDGVVVGASAWLTWDKRAWAARPNLERQMRLPLEFALAIVAILLISPHSQVYTFVWALLSILVLGVILAREWPRWWGAVAALAVGYLLVGRAYMLFRPGLTRLVQAHYLFGALLLWALLGYVLWRIKRASADS